MYPLYAPSPVHTKVYGSLYTPVLNFLQGGGREKRGERGGELLVVVVVGKTNGYRRGTALFALLSMQEN
jgi:hypothetical protein